ncbi:MAG TPA: hypothetical protein VIN09_02265 [Chloroflexota bacterium]
MRLARRTARRWRWWAAPAALLLAVNVARRRRERRLTRRELAVDARTEALLKDLLTPEQYRQMQATGYFVVPSPGRPGRVYHVPRHPGYVRVYEEGQLVELLCAEPEVPLPPGDVAVMHKLMIEGNEEEYLRLANRVSAFYHPDALGW